MISKLIYRFFSAFVGIYIGSEKVFICVPSKNVIKEHALPSYSESQNSIKDKITDCVSIAASSTRKYFKKWPLLRMVVCTEYDSPKLSNDSLQEVIDHFNAEISYVDIRICFAIGIGLSIADEVKHMVIIVSDKYVHGYIVFCADIFNEIRYERRANGDTNELIENLIADFEKTVGTKMPTHFTKLNLSEGEFLKISNGWRGGFHQNINVIPLLKSEERLSIGDNLKGYKIKLFLDDYEYIKKAITEITENFGILVPD